MAIFGLSRVRTELFQLLVVPFLAHHPEQTNGQSPRHRHLGDPPSAPHRQMEVLTTPFRETAHRDLGRFHQQEAQDRTALLRNVSQPSPFPAGVFQRHQSQIARNLLPALESFRLPDDQHESKSGQCTDTGMRPQPLHRRILVGLMLDRLRQLCDRRIQSIQ